MHLEKNRTYACTFPVQRKEIDVVKVRFTMRYSSRKLSNDKVITTACNFWGQIACSFQVMSGNILFLGYKIFEIPPFFQTRPGDLGKKVHACSLRFSALKKWTGLRSSYGKISSPLAEISGTEPACPLTWTRRNFFTKDLEVRRDLEHQASPVKRAHMKRPILSFSNSKDDYVDVLYIDPAKEKLTFYGTKNSKSTENRQTFIR